jgi:outer membrane protein assembly factor BamB
MLVYVDLKALFHTQAEEQDFAMKFRFWQWGLAGCAAALAVWFGWRYASQKVPVLLALYTETGQVSWLQQLPTSVLSRGPLISDNKVLLDSCRYPTEQDDESQSCRVYDLRLLDLQSGKVLWSRSFTPTKSLASTLAWSESILFEHGQILVQVDGQLHALDVSTGKTRWSVQRRWLSDIVNGEIQASTSGLGVLSIPDQKQFVIQQLQTGRRIVQILDANTGKLVRQFAIPLDKLTSIDEDFATNHRSLFVRTSGLLPSNQEPNTFSSSGRSTLTAYDLQTGKIQFRQNIVGEIPDAQAVQNRLNLWLETPINSQASAGLERFFWVIDSNSGKVLWRKNLRQANCSIMGQPARMMPEAIYTICLLRAGTNLAGQAQDTKVIALQVESGQLKWQSSLGNEPNPMDKYFSIDEDFPITLNPKSLFTFRELNSPPSKQRPNQFQVLALDRQTGLRQWDFTWFEDDSWSYKFKRLAANQDHLVFLNRLPLWQIWLLNFNSAWYIR